MTSIAVVTGGAGGMGLSTARILGCDHHVVLADLDQERLNAAVLRLGRDSVTASAVVCDITSRPSVRALFETATGLGSVRAVVHTAGISPQMGTADTIVRVNALGTINVTEASLDVAIEGSALINVASLAGHMTPSLLVPERLFHRALTDRDHFIRKLSARVSLAPKALRPGIGYSLSKAFVIWYSAQMAARFGEKGARILSVSPGSIDTDMGRLEIESGSAKMLEFAALKRFGSPEEVAELLAFCASDMPGYLTGIDILCDGGTKAGLTLRGVIAMTRGD